MVVLSFFNNGLALAACNEDKKVTQFIENNAVLTDLDAAVKYFYANKEQQLCQWLKKRDQFVIESNIIEIGFYERNAICDFNHKLIDLYVAELNKGLIFCDTDDCFRAKQKINPIAIIYQTSDQYKKLSVGASVRKDLLDPSSKLSRLVFEKNDIDGACGKFVISLLTQGDVKDGINFNHTFDRHLEKEHLQLKEEPLKTDAVFKALFERQEFEYIFEETPEFEDDLYFSYSQNLYHYSGGAHGNSVVNYITLDKNTGERLKISQVLDPKYKSAILKIAKANLLSNERYTSDPKKSLRENGYWFHDAGEHQSLGEWSEESGFYLPENFLVVSDGLVFLYNQYEVAPYAMGTPTLKIDWSELEHLD